MSYVYVISWSERGPSKVGVTQSIPRRLDSLQTGCPYLLRVFFAASVPSSLVANETEATILQDFRALRMIGEWLRLPPKAIAEAIKSTLKDQSIPWAKWQPTPGQKADRERQLDAKAKRSDGKQRKAFDESLRAKIALDEYDWLIKH